MSISAIQFICLSTINLTIEAGAGAETAPNLRNIAEIWILQIYLVFHFFQSRKSLARGKTNVPKQNQMILLHVQN